MGRRDDACSGKVAPAGEHTAFSRLGSSAAVSRELVGTKHLEECYLKLQAKDRLQQTSEAWSALMDFVGGSPDDWTVARVLSLPRF